MHKYWCHKTEALKSNCKKQYTYFHSGPGFLTRNTFCADVQTNLLCCCTLLFSSNSVYVLVV